MWGEMAKCFQQADSDKNVRVIIFSGKGPTFTEGTCVLQDCVSAILLLRTSSNQKCPEFFLM